MCFKHSDAGCTLCMKCACWDCLTKKKAPEMKHKSPIPVEDGYNVSVT